MRSYIEIREVKLDVSSSFTEEEASQIKKAANGFLNLSASREYEYSREIEDALEISLFNRTGLVCRVFATVENTYYDEELKNISVAKGDFYQIIQ